jgi:hypothetical protein
MTCHTIVRFVPDRTPLWRVLCAGDYWRVLNTTFFLSESLTALLEQRHSERKAKNRRSRGALHNVGRDTHKPEQGASSGRTGHPGQGVALHRIANAMRCV